MIEKDDLMTVAQVVNMIKASSSYVYRLIDTGAIKSYNIAKRNGIRVYRSDVERYIKSNEKTFA